MVWIQKVNRSSASPGMFDQRTFDDVWIAAKLTMRRRSAIALVEGSRETASSMSHCSISFCDTGALISMTQAQARARMY